MLPSLFVVLYFFLTFTNACDVSSLAHGSEIQNNGLRKVLLIGRPQTVCFEYAKQEFANRGCEVTIKELNAMELREYQDCYPDEKIGGSVMHSFVYVGQEMVGNGHQQASTWENAKLNEACPQKSKEEVCTSGELGKIGEKIQAILKTSHEGIYLWGWNGCPCVATARARFASQNVCFKEETWDTPSDPRMAYFQKCTEATANDHSFIFMWDGSKMGFVGNGFVFENTGPDKMDDSKFNLLVSTSKAKTSCELPGIEGKALNLFNEPLQKCSSTGNVAGSAQADGKCDELGGGVHSLCVDKLPADFSGQTGQSAWSENEQGKPWCVCIGAWSLYQSKGLGHQVKANCNAIPDFVFQNKYIQNWSTWNGNELDDQIVDGINALFTQCSSEASESQLSGLKKNYCNIVKQYRGKSKEFRTTSEFKAAGCEGGLAAASADVTVGSSIQSDTSLIWGEIKSEVFTQVAVVFLAALLVLIGIHRVKDFVHSKVAYDGLEAEEI